MQVTSISVTDPTLKRMTLLASRSKLTGKGIFPRVPHHSPVGKNYEDIELAGPAFLYSYTIIHPSPKTGLSPFALAYADFPEEVRVFARLDCPLELIRIDMNVEPRVAGDGFVLVPAEER